MSDRMKALCEAVSEFHDETGRFPDPRQVAAWCQSTLDAAVRAVAIVRHKLEYA